MLDKRFLKTFRSQLDYVLIAMVMLLAGIGLVVIYSATKSLDSHTKQMVVQCLAFGLGLVAMLVMSFIDYERYRQFVKLIFGASVGILVLVLLIGIGSKEVGAKSWIRLGGVSIQPSELVKVAFAVTFAVHLEHVQKDINKFTTILGLLVHFGILAGLVVLQNDTGTALAFLCMFLGMVFVAGISYKYVLIALAGAAAFVPFAYFVLMSDYQRNRILVFLHPETDLGGAGYQVMQSKIAIGSGGLLGRGYLQGPQNQLALLPEKDTDFIYGVIGEELGFIGCIIVFALLLMVILRCLHIARTSKDKLGSYICVGIAAMLMFHTFENIGMCIGLLPVTGIPLPFISYGGSSMVTNLAAIGLVLSVGARRKTINFGIKT